MPILGELNEKAVTVKQVQKVLNKMKMTRAPGLDGCSVKCLKNGTK